MFGARDVRSVLLWSAGLLCLAGSASADNLIVNGDFAAGNTGFTSGYTYVAPGTNACWPEGTYSIVASPTDCHSLWASFGDHTSGTGNMMVVNGATTGNVTVWSEVLSVTANSEYDLSAWVASVYPSSPAPLEFFVNGIQVGNLFTASATTGLWQQFSTTWSSGVNSTATLAIVDTSVIASGNDFALDDLSFSSVPEPGSWLLLCVLLPGLFFPRRGLARRYR